MTEGIEEVIARLIDKGIRRQAFELHQHNLALTIAYADLVNMMDLRGLLPKDQVLLSLEKTARHTGDIEGSQAVQAYLRRLAVVLRETRPGTLPEEARKGFRVISEDPPEPEKNS